MIVLCEIGQCVREGRGRTSGKTVRISFGVGIDAFNFILAKRSDEGYWEGIYYFMKLSDMKKSLEELGIGSSIAVIGLTQALKKVTGKDLQLTRETTLLDVDKFFGSTKIRETKRGHDNSGVKALYDSVYEYVKKNKADDRCDFLVNQGSPVQVIKSDVVEAA